MLGWVFAEDGGEEGFAVGEGSGFIDDEGSTGGDFFEDCGVFDDDAAACGDGDGADDGDGDSDQQGAGGGDDEDGEEALGVSADEPTESGGSDGDGGVPAAKTIAETAHTGAALLGLVEDADDLGVAGVAGEASGADFEEDVAVDGSREDGAAGSLGDLEGLAGEIGLVHGAGASEDDAVDGADLVGIEDDFVVNGDGLDGDVLRGTGGIDAVGGLGHAAGERAEDGRGLAGGVILEAFSAGEHKNHDGRNPVLTHDERGNDGEQCKEVDAEVAVEDLAEEVVEERCRTDENAAEEDG